VSATPVSPVTPVTPVSPFTPVAPDADWETMRARVMAALASAAAPKWTDHNATDPGVTVLEAMAFGLADLHYRTFERPLDAWPLEVRGWLAEAQRHWHSTLPTGTASALATALATPMSGSTAARVLEPLVRACHSSSEALALFATAPWAATFTPGQRIVVMNLMRSRLVRQVAHEFADLIADAVGAERASGDPVEQRDARAASELAFSLPMWPDELAAVVRRERRRLSAEALVARLDEVRAVTVDAQSNAVAAALGDADLSTDEVSVALDAAAVPVHAMPEDMEEPSGQSRLWPPHPLQSLTCEPVTSLDYARRARAHPQVARAWAVSGRLAGVGWDGAVVGTGTGQIPPDPSAIAITLVVERAGGGGTVADYLRAVLATAIGSEVTRPHPDWRDTYDPLDPRRLICDEVGATVLKKVAITLQGRLVTGVGADRAATIADAGTRIAAFFAQGRPESRAPAETGPDVSGPWERHDQPALGWNPAEPIRFTEVVETIMTNPAVLGVEQLAMKVGVSGVFVPSSAGQVEIPRDAVPELGPNQCLTLRFALTGECADA
jgi:hypothetical protein